DAIVQVVRCFENDDVIHVAGKVDPLSDIEIINTELALADLETVERNIQRTEKVAKSGDKDAKARLDVLSKVKAVLDEGRAARVVELDKEERRLIRDLNLLTIKPLLYVANGDESGFENDPRRDKVRGHAARDPANREPGS